MFHLKKMIKRIENSPLTREELIRWLRGHPVTDNDIRLSAFRNHNITTNEELKELINSVKQALPEFINSYPYDRHLYEKYDRPLRLERNKKRNKKLSEWHGRRTNDYSGIDIDIDTDTNAKAKAKIA